MWSGLETRMGRTTGVCFQLNDGGTLQSLGGTTKTALDARWNVLAAKRLCDKLGFRPWTCRRG